MHRLSELDAIGRSIDVTSFFKFPFIKLDSSNLFCFTVSATSNIYRAWLPCVIHPVYRSRARLSPAGREVLTEPSRETTASPEPDSS